MRLATIELDGRQRVARVTDGRVDPLRDPLSMRAVAALGADALAELVLEVYRDPDRNLNVDEVQWAPAIPDPGAIFTIGANYRRPGELGGERPDRPMVLGKLPSSVAAHLSAVAWDRSVTANVDGECELGVVIGAGGGIFGFTIVNDLNSVDPWLDGAHWLLGKSMAGFCPVGPWIVTADELDPHDLRLGATINGEPIQDGRTADMRFTIPELIAFISRHVTLQPGDLIATGTPIRLDAPPGPERHLQAGDVVTVWIEGIGELTTTIA
jgi:2-keto-4-pentenoate hydratase/2-oxohepta-3-ene-1,7-dioic acid hydratase in catechol pathway